METGLLTTSGVTPQGNPLEGRNPTPFDGASGCWTSDCGHELRRHCVPGRSLERGAIIASEQDLRLKRPEIPELVQV